MHDSLPILQVPIPLRRLRAKIHKVAREQQVVPRRDGEGVAHKGPGVEAESAGHAAGNAAPLCQKCSFSTNFRVVAPKCGRSVRTAYISGSFCVSMTAAIGMPKLETGPQKSAEGDVRKSCGGGDDCWVWRIGTYASSRHNLELVAT